MFVLQSALANAAPVDDLAADDPARVRAALTEIEKLPGSTPDLAETLFAAARACEDTLADPARALALYERILREQPDARVAASAQRRAEALRERVGVRSEHAGEAAEFSRLVADADRMPPAEIERRAAALAAAAWPGAPEAALWLAEWLRRNGRLADASAQFDLVVARWPETPYATSALRSAAGAALEAHEWSRAEELAHRLPAVEPADRILRDDLLANAELGRSRARWLVVAWLAMIASLLAMLGSLGDAALRHGRTRPLLRRLARPPFEVWFLGPIAVVLVGVAFTAHRLIAPAVTALAAFGVVIAWLSGTALDLLRSKQREVRRRAVLHICVAVAGIAALFYIVLMRDNLLDLVIETVQFGPEP